MGYRHYDRTGLAPRFCFGHGLSYTRFDYANLVASSDGAGARVSVDVTNVGDRAGQEVVQVYVRDPASTADRPERELREFAKLELDAGQRRTVTFDLASRAFAHWDTQQKAWRVVPGEREILVGSSSRDIRQVRACEPQRSRTKPNIVEDSNNGQPDERGNA